MASNNRLTFEGIQEFYSDLRELAPRLSGEGQRLREASANSAALEVRTAYGKHRRTGTLQDRVTVQHSQFRSTVKNGAPHAWIFEHGTQARHTSLGVSRGAMPPGHIFVPIMIRARRKLLEALKALVQRSGLRVA